MIVELQRRPSVEVKGLEDPLNQKLMSLLLAAYHARMQEEWHSVHNKMGRIQGDKSQGDLLTETTKLLKQGADPNRATLPIKGFCHTPLTLAVHVGNPALVRALLSAGAAPFFPDPSGRTAVQHAISNYGSLGSTSVSKDILQRLLMSAATECDCTALLAGLKLACNNGRNGLSEVLAVIFRWGYGIHRSVVNRKRKCCATMMPKDNSDSPDVDSAHEVLFTSILHGGDLTFAKDFITSLWFSQLELQVILTKVAKKSKYFRTVVHHFGTKSTQGFLHKMHKSLDKCCGKYIVDIEEYREVLQDYQDFLEWIEEEMYSPPSLAWHARRSTLSSLNERLVPAVPQLGLPKLLEKYLLFEDLQHH